MNAVVMMLGAAFLWSLYPALIAISGDQIGAPVFIMVIHISCGLSAALFAYCSIKQKKTVWHNIKIVTKSLNFDQWLYLMLIGFVSTLYNLCFIVAIGTTSKIGAAIIIEAWPLFAMFLAPLLVTKDWSQVKLRDYVAGVVALIGVGLIMIADQKDLARLITDYRNFIVSDDFWAITGIMAALIGSICLALSIVLCAEISNKISTVILQEKDYSMTCAYIGETIRRIVALPTSLLLIFIFSDDLGVSYEGVAIGTFVGIFIFSIGSMAVTLALLKAPSSTINMLYYISPILAVLWLYLMDLGEITPMIIVGGALVICANLITLDRHKKKQEKAS